MLYKRLGENLKNIRIARGLTVEDISERLGITVDAVRKYESGARRVPLDVLINGCVILDCSVMTALQGLDPRRPDTSGVEYNVLSPSESAIMTYLATQWDGDIKSLVVADALYAAIPPKYRREVIMSLICTAEKAIKMGDMSRNDLPEEMDYMKMHLGKLYEGESV